MHIGRNLEHCSKSQLIGDFKSIIGTNLLLSQLSITDLRPTDNVLAI